MGILFQIKPTEFLMNQVKGFAKRYIWIDFCAMEHIIYFGIPVNAKSEIRPQNHELYYASICRAEPKLSVFFESYSLK